MQKSDRANSLDLLRIIACFSVIMIHVSAYFYSNCGDFSNGSLWTQADRVFASIYNACSRFAIPVFVLLSGAFVLSDDRNGDYFYFYRKTLIKLVIPTLIYGFLYSAYELLNGQGIKETIINFALGKPMYHMWFMYMIICLYLLTPFLVNFRKTLAIKTIYITSFALLIVNFAGEFH